MFAITLCDVIADVRNGGPKGTDVCLNHLFIDRDYDGGVVGLAFVGSICDSTIYGKYVQPHAGTHAYLSHHFIIFLYLFMGLNPFVFVARTLRTRCKTLASRAVFTVCHERTLFGFIVFLA